jgi:uncharacterized protein (TIGR02594 family)
MYHLGLQWVGTKEVRGSAANESILSWLRLDTSWPTDDSIPWCSAWVNYLAKCLAVSRSHDLRARSWLRIGSPVPLGEAEQGFDVVVLSRGEGEQPGPDVIDAPGHVGLYSGRGSGVLLLLGGNQGDAVTIQEFPAANVLGVRRLA